MAGRKSESAAKAAKAAKYVGKTEFSKSSAVFAKIQEQRDAAAAGVKVGKKKGDGEKRASSAALKL